MRCCFGGRLVNPFLRLGCLACCKPLFAKGSFEHLALGGLGEGVEDCFLACRCPCLYTIYTYAHIRVYTCQHSRQRRRGGFLARRCPCLVLLVTHTHMHIHTHTCTHMSMGFCVLYIHICAYEHHSPPPAHTCWALRAALASLSICATRTSHAWCPLAWAAPIAASVAACCARSERYFAVEAAFCAA